MKAIGIVPPNETLVAVWADVDELFKRFGEEWLEVNELTPEDLFVKFLTQKWELWLGTDGVDLDALMVTARNGPELEVLFLGGEKLDKYLLDGLCTLERFAVSCEAREISLGGRPGWEKVLEKFKYERHGDRLRKDLVKAYAH